MLPTRASRHVCTACLRGIRQKTAEAAIPRPSHLQTRRLNVSAVRAQKQQKYQTPKPRANAASPQPSTNAEVSAAPQTNDPSGFSTASLARVIRDRAPSFTETYVAYGTCETLVNECARMADYTIPESRRHSQLMPDAERGIDVGEGSGWWYESFGLQPSFNTWAQITLLHMWLLTVRLRTFPAAHAPAWHQHLTDHFFHLAEDKMVELHGLVAKSIRNRYLKDLFVQWRGLTAAYDQGLVEGDAVLAAAIWRNICGADENVDLVKLTQVTSYVRSVLKGLEEISDEDLASGEVEFETPESEAALVMQPTASIATNSIAANGGTIDAGSPERPKRWAKVPQGTVVKGPSGAAS